jgi:DNA (cytosine-5)-methyltransferase 1
VTPTAVSLFAGIGGIDRALDQAGFDVKAAVEKDPAARGVLADRRPGTTLLKDITEVGGDDLRAAGFVPRRGLLAAGWPCQGNSPAGARGGMDDPRSGLWRDVVRLLAETRPRWFLGENVPGLLSVNDGTDFGIVLGDLADLGYGVAWRVLDAQFFGVPQRRRRVIVVGCLGDGAAPVEVLLEPEGGRRDPAPRATAQPHVAATLTAGSHRPGVSVAGRRREDDVNLVAAALTASGVGTCGADDNQAQAGHLIAHTLTANGFDASEDGTGRGTPLVPYSLAVAGDISTGRDVAQTIRAANGQPGTVADVEMTVRRLTPVECERLQGFPDGWTATSNGKPQADSPRYHQLGNSVAVPCIAWITHRIARAA